MKKIIILASFFIYGSAIANVIGTEYQNFNPSISGTDFTSVHSSEPVKQCMCNLGVFLNYAKNTLTYSDKYYQTNTDLKGVRANDFLMGADLYGTYGINDNWDIGVALPFIVVAKNDDPYGVSYFDQFGLTEIRPMTKYRLFGDDDGGMAIIASANFNTIKNNPFSGDNPGPTLNLEVAADTTIFENVKIAGNLGIRKRNSGNQLIDQTTGLPVPFVPFSDSLIYSLAVAKKFDSLKSDLLAELNGSQPGGIGSDSVKTAQQALEIGLGIRYYWSKSTVIHAGGGSKLADAQSTPDIRAYVGLNYQVGPVCDNTPTPIMTKKVVLPTALVLNHPKGSSAVTELNLPVTALNPADYAAYRWKIGSTPKINCHDQSGYSDEIQGDLPIIKDIAVVPDGGITLCAVAKNQNGEWQSFEEPTIVNWVKSKTPVAIVKDHPVGVSDKIDLKMPVSSNNPADFAAYRWKIGATPETDCKTESNYSAEIPGNLPIVTGIGPIPDGGITLCAVAKNKSGMWQPFKTPTIINWQKKKGYELFRLNVSVLFDFDEDVLQKRSYSELAKINSHLIKKPFTLLIIEGHTDSIGTDAYNMDLSKRRARRVMNYMIKTFSLKKNKVRTDFKGEKFPVDTNETKEGRENNRRVEFKIFRK